MNDVINNGVDANYTIDANYTNFIDNFVSMVLTKMEAAEYKKVKENTYAKTITNVEQCKIEGGFFNKDGVYGNYTVYKMLYVKALFNLTNKEIIKLLKSDYNNNFILLKSGLNDKHCTNYLTTKGLNTLVCMVKDDK